MHILVERESSCKGNLEILFSIIDIFLKAGAFAKIHSGGKQLNFINSNVGFFSEKKLSDKMYLFLKEKGITD